METLNSTLSRIKSELIPYGAFVQQRIVTWTGFWVTIPVSVITAVLFINPDKSTLRGILTWTAIGLLSHASMVPFVHHMNKRGSRRAHLLMAFFLGALRGVVLSLIAPLFLVEDPLPVIARAVNSGFAFLYYFVIVSIIQGVWGKFEKEKPQTLIFNYELGILIPPKLNSKSAKEQIMKNLGIKLPASAFNEDKEPFFSNE